MKMIFHADEMVSINSHGCETMHVQKQKIADYLTENVKEDNCLENAVVLSFLPPVRSIYVGEKTGLITLYPNYTVLSVSEELYEFLYDLLISK